MKLLRTLSIGDIHGLNVWKKAVFGEIYNIDDFDKVIFVGDYVDSFNITPIEQIHNLRQIIELKKKYPEKVVLLIGNHCIQYMFFPKYRCSGFQAANYMDYYKLYNDNRELFQLSYQIQNTLWSHAGIHKGWYNQNIKKIHDKSENTISEIINRDFWMQKPWIYQVGFIRGGASSVGGPLWLDRRMLWKKPLVGYHQIVGHTRISGGGIKDYQLGSETRVTCIDVLEDGNPEFFIKEFELN
jgi:predicted MPP superfamily phosphohydrolase